MWHGKFDVCSKDRCHAGPKVRKGRVLATGIVCGQAILEPFMGHLWLNAVSSVLPTQSATVCLRTCQHSTINEGGGVSAKYYGQPG